MSTHPANIDRIEYTLSHADYPPLIITEPVGWKTDEKEIGRTKYDGIITQFTGSLKFVGDGADYITTIYEIYGINELVTLKRRERHPITNAWSTSYVGIIDMSTYETQNGEVNVKFNNSGLEELLKSHESKKIEIERLDDLDGNEIDALETKIVQFDGRRIFLKSEWDVSNTNNSANASVESNAGNTRAQSVGYPFRQIVQGHLDIAQSVTPQTQAGSGTSVTIGELGMMFLFDNSRDRTIDINVSGVCDLLVQQHENVQWATYWICITKYENGFNFDVKQRIPLFKLEENSPVFGNEYDGAILPFTHHDVEFSYQNDSYELLAGESVAIECYLVSDMFVDVNAGVRVSVQNATGSIRIDEDSFFESTQSKMILAHELGERLTYVMTGQKGLFYSKALGRTDINYDEDGDSSLIGFAHGHWIRGFDRLPLDDEENRYKPFTTTFKDFVECMSVTRNLGIGIEKIGYNERIRMEGLEYFYNNNVLIKLGREDENGNFIYPRVDKLKRSVAVEYFYDKLQIGSQKGWENEEAMGLDEYNTRTDFSTAITRIQKTFLKVTAYVLGSYAQEFVRRKPKVQFSTFDHKFDKEIFPLDLKRGFGDVFLERKWQDDFEVEPTGVFSPETANKLRFSPVNILLKHAWWIAGCVTKYIDKYILFGGSEGNSNLETQLIGGQPYKENGYGETSNVIQNIELERARFVPEWIEFEFPCSYLIMEQVEGKTTILGEEIPNFYGLVQFRNEKGQLEKGFLFNLKPEGAGKWKLLKANR